MSFKDAAWWERVSTVTLIAGITGIGLAPLWLSNMITGSLQHIIERLTL
jgi:NADH-quinone oxidoreductase subunit M